ncbi:hypothetical protein cand_020390 [Cryptosporidium andersoni]|uniref:Uncharacterized protein n=1 Tax=Cryptosporidium andersoni TaxID=117008 RepID=A0A1J4MSH7_9CRYT|nr:hypothetical protein cand_020390 [Cryptosporidium andersoni]
MAIVEDPMVELQESLNILKCQLFSEQKRGKVECLTLSPDGYFCAISRNGGNITVCDTLTFHPWLSIPGSRNCVLRSLFLIRKFESKDLNDDNMTQLDSDTDVQSVFSETTACTSPNKTPNRITYGDIGVDNVLIDGAHYLENYRLIGTGLDGNITEWDICTGRVLDSLLSFGGAIFQGALSPNETQLAVACTDGSIRIFSLLNNMVTYSYGLPRHSSSILSLTFMTEDYIFAGSSDGCILQYNLKSKICVERMTVQAGKKITDRNMNSEVSVWCLLYIESEGVLFSGDSNGVVMVWDLDTYTALNVFQQHQADVLTLSILYQWELPNKNMCIVSTGMDGRVVSYINSTNGNKNMEIGTTRWLPTDFCYPHSSHIGAISTVSDPQPNGPIAITGSWDGSLVLWIAINRSRNNNQTCIRSRNSKLNHHFKTLPIGVAVEKPVTQISLNERLILHQNEDFLDIWFILEHKSANPNSIESSILHTPLQSAYKSLNSLTYSFAGESYSDISFVPIQPVKLLQLKFATVQNPHIICSALSHKGNYIVGSILSDGIKGVYLDLENLQVADIPLESTRGIEATSMIFISNTILVIGGYNSESRLSTNLQVLIVDVERDIILSSVLLNPRKCYAENSKISHLIPLGSITKMIASADNQWLGITTSWGDAFIVALDSMKVVCTLPRPYTTTYRSIGFKECKAPIVSVCFSPYEKDTLAAMTSDGFYYIYSITMNKILPLYQNTDNSLESNIDHNFVAHIPKKIYSPLKHGPIFSITWTINGNIFNNNNSTTSSKSKTRPNHILVINTSGAICHVNLNRDPKSSNVEVRTSTVNITFSETLSAEKYLCGPVYDLPRFKKAKLLSDIFMLFPERGIESELVDFTKSAKIHQEIQSMIYKKSDRQSFVSPTMVYAVFWVNSPKWMCLTKNYEFGHIDGFLIVISSRRSTTESSDSSSNDNTFQRKRYAS